MTLKRIRVWVDVEPDDDGVWRSSTGGWDYYDDGGRVASGVAGAVEAEALTVTRTVVNQLTAALRFVGHFDTYRPGHMDRRASDKRDRGPALEPGPDPFG